MNYSEPRLTQYEPIDALWIRLELGQYGWELSVGHRHQCGQYGDCETAQYSAMTMGEALDVIEATAMTIGHSE